MKTKILMAGTIVAALALCLAAATALSLQSQPPDQPVLPEPQPSEAQETTAGEMVAQASMMAPAPQQQPLASLQPPAVSGHIIDTYGKKLEGETVTLHLMDYEMTDGQISSVREVGQLTATTNAAGEYRFSGIALAPDVNYGYVSVTHQIPDGPTIYGYGLNFTLNGDSDVGSSIVLHLAP